MIDCPVDSCGLAVTMGRVGGVYRAAWWRGEGANGRVRYYFVPYSRPCLPVPHVFGHPTQSDWRDAVNDLGEGEPGVNRGWETYAFEDPPDWPADDGPVHYCGSEEAWLGGRRGTDPPLTWVRGSLSTCCAAKRGIQVAQLTGDTIPVATGNYDNLRDGRIIDPDDPSKPVTIGAGMCGYWLCLTPLAEPPAPQEDEPILWVDESGVYNVTLSDGTTKVLVDLNRALADTLYDAAGAAAAAQSAAEAYAAGVVASAISTAETYADGAATSAAAAAITSLKAEDNPLPQYPLGTGTAGTIPIWEAGSLPGDPPRLTEISVSAPYPNDAYLTLFSDTGLIGWSDPTGRFDASGAAASAQSAAEAYADAALAAHVAAADPHRQYRLEADPVPWSDLEYTGVTAVTVHLFGSYTTTANTWNSPPFNSDSEDALSEFAGIAATFTPQESGMYLMTVGLGLSGAGTARQILALWDNNTSTNVKTIWDAPVGAMAGGTFLVQLTAGHSYSIMHFPVSSTPSGNTAAEYSHWIIRRFG